MSVSMLNNIHLLTSKAIYTLWRLHCVLLPAALLRTKVWICELQSERCQCEQFKGMSLVPRLVLPKIYFCW